MFNFQLEAPLQEASYQGSDESITKSRRSSRVLRPVSSTASAGTSKLDPNAASNFLFSQSPSKSDIFTPKPPVSKKPDVPKLKKTSETPKPAPKSSANFLYSSPLQSLSSDVSPSPRIGRRISLSLQDRTSAPPPPLPPSPPLTQKVRPSHAKAVGASSGIAVRQPPPPTSLNAVTPKPFLPIVPKRGKESPRPGPRLPAVEPPTRNELPYNASHPKIVEGFSDRPLSTPQSHPPSFSQWDNQSSAVHVKPPLAKEHRSTGLIPRPDQKLQGMERGGSPTPYRRDDLHNPIAGNDNLRHQDSRILSVVEKSLGADRIDFARPDDPDPFGRYLHKVSLLNSQDMTRTMRSVDAELITRGLPKFENERPFLASSERSPISVSRLLNLVIPQDDKKAMSNTERRSPKSIITTTQASHRDTTSAIDARSPLHNVILPDRHSRGLAPVGMQRHLAAPKDQQKAYSTTHSMKPITPLQTDVSLNDLEKYTGTLNWMDIYAYTTLQGS